MKVPIPQNLGTARKSLQEAIKPKSIHVAKETQVVLGGLHVESGRGS
jgi:hypothetical protein